MIKFIVDEQAAEDGAHYIHNATLGCEKMPEAGNQIFIGFFATFELVYKRARMNWPTEKVKGCPLCCVEAKA